MPDLPINPYKIDYIIVYIVVVVIIFIIKMFLQSLSKDIQQKVNQKKFVRFLRLNKSIDDCIKQYAKIGFLDRPEAIFYLCLGAVLAFIMSFLPFIIMSHLYTHLYEGKMTDAIALTSILLSMTIPLMVAFISIVFIQGYINSDVGKNIFVERQSFCANMLTSLNFYILFSYPMILIFLSLIIFNLNQTLNLGAPTTFLFAFNLVLLIIVPVGAVMQKQWYKIDLKNILNSKGSKYFPHLHVRTKENIQIDGTITDIFDNKFLILENNGVKKITLWDSVCTLEISESEAVDTLHQKKLQDYFG